jgi:hypothetical protein
MSIESHDSPPDQEPDLPVASPAGGTPPTRTNLLDHWADESGLVTEPLQAVRLDASEVILIPFTPEATQARLHYCDEPEIRGYMGCNGPGCALCRAGRNVEERALLPIYQPATRSIAVLSISPNSRPGALRPQILPILRSGRRVALSISKPDRAMFRVSAIDLGPGMDDGARVIADFLPRWDAGEVDLASVYPRLSNRDLAAIPGIATTLAYKGITPDDLD